MENSLDTHFNLVEFVQSDKLRMHSANDLSKKKILLSFCFFLSLFFSLIFIIIITTIIIIIINERMDESERTLVYRSRETRAIPLDHPNKQTKQTASCNITPSQSTTKPTIITNLKNNNEE